MKKNWPVLQFSALEGTVATVQLWTQIVGKVRLVQMPWINHSWHVSLYISPSGLTTRNVPYKNGLFQIDFDFIRHALIIITSSGDETSFQLYPRTVSEFYEELMEKLQLLGIEATIYARPNELEEAIPFASDNVHKTYDPKQMHLLWKAWVNIHSVFTEFRAKFCGKCSPVHLFWGGFDLAVTRFSGRKAPPHPGGMPHMPLDVMQEAYSHEVSSCGFWIGDKTLPYPSFYSYCYPTPEAFGTQKIKPEKAFFSKEMGEFFLPYNDVINASDSEEFLLQFLQSTYAAAATTANWDREALETDLSGYKKKIANK